MIKLAMAKQRVMRISILVTSGACMFGILDSCNDNLVAFTRFVDPCGTILANCNPGDFEVRNAEIGDFCVDPGCTIPGGCGTVALGTITDVCP